MAKYKVIRNVVPHSVGDEIESDKELDSLFFEKVAEEEKPKRQATKKKLITND